MNFHWPFSKPAAQPLRAIVATKAESFLARRKRADLRMEFEIMRLHMTDEQFEAAKVRGGTRSEAEIARARKRHEIRRRGKGK